MVNNYREREKTLQALQNLTRCTGQPLETVDHGVPEFERKVLELSPDLVILTGSTALLTRSGTREEFQQEAEFVKKAPVPILGICFAHQLIGTAFGSGLSDLGQMLQRFDQMSVVQSHPWSHAFQPTI